MVLNLTKKWNEWKKNLQKRSHNEPLHIMVTRKQGTCKGYGIFFLGGELLIWRIYKIYGNKCRN